MARYPRMERENRKCKMCDTIFMVRISSKRKYCSLGCHYEDPEFRNRMSLTQKGVTGYKHSEETRKKISESNMGKVMSLESRKKISDSHMGKSLSDEHKKSIGNAEIGENNPFYGKHHTEETRKRLREVRRHLVIPSKDTTIEVKLQEILDKEGISFIKHAPVVGQPDIFIEPNICIFADGDYWHNTERGKKRDVIVNKSLLDEGYKVLRFWEHEINGSLEDCFNKIKQEMN